jgi:hypothetical protein
MSVVQSESLKKFTAPNWCFTVPNVKSTQGFLAKPLDSSVNYAVWQVEKTASSSIIRGYIEFNSKPRLTGVQRYMPEALASA